MTTFDGMLIAAAVFLMFVAARYFARKPAKIEAATGAGILEYGWIFLLVALTSLLMAIIGCFVAAFVPFKDADEPYIAAALILFFAAAGIALCLETTKVRITMTKDEIVGLSPWRKRRSIRWDDIEYVTYSSLNRWFVVVDSRGKKIRVFLLLNGVRSFIQAVRNRVPYDRYRDAEVGFRVLDSWGM